MSVGWVGDPFATPERLALRESAAGFVRRHVVPHLAEWEEAGEIPRSLHREAAAAGLLGIGFPEEVGGAIDVHGHGDLAVPQDRHGHPRVDVQGDEQRGARSPGCEDPDSTLTVKV